MPPIWGPLAAVLLALFPAVRVSTVQVAEPPPAITAPATSRCPEWYTVALDSGFTPEDWSTLDRIIWCESRCDPSAHNRSGAAGLAQIMPMHWHGRDPYDPATNLTMAHEVLERQGWRAWSCF